MAKRKFSKVLGRGLAHVQALADDLVTAGFRKMAEAGKVKKRRKKAKRVLGKVKNGLVATAGFLGETGEAFYEKYEEIKAEKREHKD